MNDLAWIECEARVLAKRWDCSYSLVLFAGMHSANLGDDCERICEAMNDYCRSKGGVPALPEIEKHGTG